MSDSLSILCVSIPACYGVYLLAAPGGGKRVAAELRDLDVAWLDRSSHVALRMLFASQCYSALDCKEMLLGLETVIV